MSSVIPFTRDITIRLILFATFIAAGLSLLFKNYTKVFVALWLLFVGLVLYDVYKNEPYKVANDFKEELV